MNDEEKGARIYDRKGVRGSHQPTVPDSCPMVKKGISSRSGGDRTRNGEVVAGASDGRRNVYPTETRQATQRQIRAGYESQQEGQEENEPMNTTSTFQGLTPREAERCLTAVHEAGHAAMCIITRQKFSHVTIRKQGDASGHVAFSRTCISLERPSAVSKIGRAIMIDVAGMIAETVLLRSLDMTDADIEAAIENVCTASAQDFMDALTYADAIYPEDQLGPEPKLRFVQGMSGLVNDYLTHPPFEAGLTALAAALYGSRKKIGYHQARAIFFRAVSQAGGEEYREEANNRLTF